MSNPVKGRRSRLYIESPAGSGTFIPITGERNLSFSSTTNEIDASSKDDTTFSKVLPGTKDGAISFDFLHNSTDLSFQILRDADEAGTGVLVREYFDGSPIREATMEITSFETVHNNGDVSVTSVQSRVSGAWSSV